MALRRCATLARLVVAVSLLVASSATATRAIQDAPVIVASGTMGGHLFDGALFHIDEFWMRVASGTEFNRWLSQGLRRKVVIVLTTNADQFADAPNVRILSGTLIHQTAPNPTPTTIDVIGRLPEGNVPVVHILFLKDELTGSLGAVTFQTADLETALQVGVYDNAHISIVIKIE